jgi:hypothetical protein
VTERAREQVRNAKEQRFKDGLIKDLQIQLQEELDQVSKRQHEVEKLGPVLSEQLAAAKEQLVGDTISDAVYAELAAKRPEQRTLGEEVRLITYIGLAKLRQENEQLRLVCRCAATFSSSRQRTFSRTCILGGNAELSVCWHAGMLTYMLIYGQFLECP